MAVEAQLCPQCGAAVQFADGQTQIVCSHCGTTVLKTAAGAPSVEKELEAEKLIQETVKREKKLHSHGQPATGKLVSAQATDIFRQTIEGRAVLMSFAVEVQPDGEPAFAAEAKVLVGLAAVGKYQPGTLLDVRFDPQDRAQVSVEGRHGVPSSNPQEQIRKRWAEAEKQIAEGDKQIAEADKQIAEANQQLAQALGSQPSPAWGGPRPEGSVPVPAEFDKVTNLGPAAAVHEHQDQGISLFPHFGPPRPSVLVRYRDGLAFRAGKDLYTWRWEEVAVILSNVSMNGGSRSAVWTEHQYTLTKNNGEKVILDDGLKGIENAIEPIKQAVFAHLLPPLAQAYAAGQAVAFGPVTVHKQNGLQLDGKTYAWNTIMDVKIERGRLTITLRDTKKHEARASAIGNIELLAHLIGLKFYEPDLAYF